MSYSDPESGFVVKVVLLDLWKQCCSLMGELINGVRGGAPQIPRYRRLARSERSLWHSEERLLLPPETIELG